MNWQTIRYAAAWIAEGLRFWIPAQFRGIGWQAETRHFSFAGADDISQLGVREQSWARDGRLSENVSDDSSLPSSIVLDETLVFRTSINLPREAMRNVRRAVELRIDELSPLPPQDIVFSVGDIERTERNRIDVAVAIVRKSTVSHICEDPVLQPVAKITAERTSDDVFTFPNNELTLSTVRPKWLLAVAALWVSVIVLGFSLQQRNVMRAEALNAYQSDLRQAIDAARNENDLTKRLMLAARPSMSGDYAFAELISAIKKLPDGVVIEHATIEYNTVRLSVLAPSSLDWADAEFAIQRTPSDRDGFDVVGLTKAISPSRQVES